MGLTPTQRTLRALREQGRVCAIVEKWNSRGTSTTKKGEIRYGVRQDLFGILDIIALDPERGVVGVQSTGMDFGGHDKKLTEEKVQECIDWLSTPGTALELWGWRKLVKKRGGKAKVWTPRIKIYTLADFIEIDPFS